MFCQADCQCSRKSENWLKNMESEICSFCWVEGGRYRTDWLVACCMLESAERFQKQGYWTGKDEVVATCGLRESLVTKAMPPPLAPDPPAERGKERTEYPGGARSAILASSPSGRSHVSVSSMMSMLLSWMKVDMSDLLLEVPTDLALKRQTRSVFLAEEELRGTWSSCLWGRRMRSGALSEEAVRSSRSLGGEEGGTAVVSSWPWSEWGRTELKRQKSS